MSSGTTGRKSSAIANMTHKRLLMKTSVLENVPKASQKAGGADWCTDEVTVWIKTPALKEREKRKSLGHCLQRDFDQALEQRETLVTRKLHLKLLI